MDILRKKKSNNNRDLLEKENTSGSEVNEAHMR